MNRLRFRADEFLLRIGLGPKPAVRRGGPGYHGILGANLADIPDIVRLEVPIHREHMALYPMDFPGPVDHRSVGEFYRRIFSNGGGAAAVYVTEGETAGYVAWTFYNQLGALQAFVYSIGVSPAHRRRGIARKLIDHARHHASEGGAVCLKANVWAHNEASRAFFVAMGFDPVSEIYGRPLPYGGTG